MTQAQLQSDSADSADRARVTAIRPAEPLLEVTVIEPDSGWATLGIRELFGFRELWRYRDLVFQLTLRNVKVRYKQTVLGVLWAVLQPALMMVVFSYTLKRWIPGASGELPYSVYVFSGLLPWIFFQTAVTGAANSVVSSEGLVTKVYFPRLAIPFSAVAAALVDLAIAFVVLIALMLWHGIRPSANLVFVPAAVVLVTLVAMGVGSLMAALTVSYRDFRHALSFLVQIWMFATPTIYLEFEPPEGRPTTAVAGASITVEAESTATALLATDQTDSDRAEYREAGWLSRLNPMTAPIDFFRAATLGLPIPWARLIMPTVAAGALCLIGIVYFRRVEDRFADVI